ncbi:iron-siderophore ABC transporter substrate-binding protein [Microbacterium lushaniae]|uniref:iron-siderophore ABC transporter substrate-binding protein n=1 Tax=Microbacterium lushaniae TaxID=2614639 RepID=UPI001EE7F46C|nr:iron-siderophore ABC transporter substrate-binding protein [Microbacterium lushaniae]
MPRIRTAAALVAGTALLLTGCSTASSTPPDGDAPGSGSDVFPVTIQHAFGETVIESAPERVATVAWANHEVPLALGIVPVGMEKATWGDDDGDGVLPWVEERLEELDAETPVLFDSGDGIDFESVVDTRPDVILASYSGLTEEEYETLSKIAPVVAYPDVAWATSYQDMIRMNSQALGLAAEGDALVDDLEAEVDAALAENPALADATVLFSYIDPTDLSSIGFYTSHDTRPGFLVDHGLPMPSIVEEESAGTEEFYVTVSSEEADRFADVDVFVTYGDPEGELVARLQADPLLSQIPAIAEGRIAVLEDSTPLAASANPTPLSIPWGVREYFAVLAAPLG